MSEEKSDKCLSGNSLGQPYPTIFQQNNQQNSFFYDELDCNSHQYQYTCTYTEQQYTNPYSTQYQQQSEWPSQTYSQIATRKRQINSTVISGIHQKYLIDQTSPLPRKSFRSQYKKPVLKKQVLNIKKTKHKMNNEKQNAINLNLDPLSQGYSSLQIDGLNLYTMSSKINLSDDHKTTIFSQMGLKQPKALGKAKAQRDIQAILTFLEKGELPAPFINDFLQLISN